MYNKLYLEEYKRRAETPIGQEIVRSRWSLVSGFVKGGTLLDYGCGPGVFHTSGPPSFKSFGYDLNPYGGYLTIPQMDFDVVTFWDVLEHLPAPFDIVDGLNPKWLFVIFPDIEHVPIEDIRKWRHWKPKEHIHYWTLAGLTASLFGYELVHHDNLEGAMRNPENPEWITTAVYKRLT